MIIKLVKVALNIYSTLLDDSWRKEFNQTC